MGRTETRREISVTLWRRFSAWISTQGSKEESCENAGPEDRQPPGSGAECSTAGRARPASRKARGRRCSGACGLRVRSGRGVFLNGHAKFVERAVVAGVLGRDALANRLGALELRASIEEAALLAAMQFELALGTFAVGIETGSKHGAAIRTARACDGSDHA